MKIGFDNDAYVKRQKKHILERIDQFGDKLYLEFGGKLFDDYHAARVLPGFDVNNKIKLLQALKDQAEIIIVINAADIAKNKIRSDIGISYDQDVLRLIDNIRRMGLYVSSILISQYKDQPAADVFQKKLERRGEKVYIHRPIPGYPADIDRIVSEEGYGSNAYIPTTRPLVVVTAPGPGSGKMATCLSQIYHEHHRGVAAGYAKFETFPIWNIPLKHPVNLAYEAATADLNDVNMIDPFHLEAYGVTTVNYNRDIEVFPVVKTILERVTEKECVYKSPTDMGVNMAGYCFSDDQTVREASLQEIVRRYYQTGCDYKQGLATQETLNKLKLIMNQAGITPELRTVATVAMHTASTCGCPVAAIMLPDGTTVTGKTKGLLTAPAGALLNAAKQLAGVSDNTLLISPVVLEPILRLKQKTLGATRPTLTLDDVLIAWSICAATDSTAKQALEQLEQLRGCEAHASYMVPASDRGVYRQLRVNLTCQPDFLSDELYLG